MGQLKHPRLSWFHPRGALAFEKPVVVIVHNTWSSYRAFRKHISYLNSLGYSCVGFDLEFAEIKDRKRLWRWVLSPTPVYKIWRDCVASVLEAIPQKKIVYGFSCPAMAALLASAPRSDIQAVICDGGPFDDMWDCTDRLFDQFQNIPTTPLRHITTSLGVWRYGKESLKELSDALDKWSPNRPILSIRGGKDPLVFPENIEKIFAPHEHLPLTRFLLPEGQHLDGLKNFPTEYKDQLSTFLQQLSLLDSK